MNLNRALVLLFSVFGLCCAAVWNSTNTASHHFFAGTARSIDRLLSRSVVSQPGSSRFFYPIKTVDEFTYPPVGVKSAATITAVYCYDLITNGTGGFIDEMKYGPGFKNVTLKIKSKKGYGFIFQIDIFGY